MIMLLNSWRRKSLFNCNTGNPIRLRSFINAYSLILLNRSLLDTFAAFASTIWKFHCTENSSVCFRLVFKKYSLCQIRLFTYSHLVAFLNLWADGLRAKICHCLPQSSNLLWSNDQKCHLAHPACFAIQLKLLFSSQFWIYAAVVSNLHLSHKLAKKRVCKCLQKQFAFYDNLQVSKIFWATMTRQI